MSAKRNSTPVLRLLQLLLTASVVATLALPITRELHVLTTRLLLRIPGQRTFIQGQPPGCMVAMIPNVQFTDAHKAWLRANAAALPDAYVIAVHSARSFWQHSCDPPPESPEPYCWQGHPHAGWAALRMTGGIVVQARVAEEGITGDSWAATTAWDRRIDDAMVVTKHAQEMHPANGAMWVAEAALCFAQGRDEPALTALRVAAEKPDWASYDAAAFEYVVDLFRSQGLPRLDAMLYAYSGDAWVSALRAAGYARRQLHRLMAEATSHHDEAKIRALAGLLRSLHAGAWRAPYMKNVFRALPSLCDDTDLLVLMAEQGGLQIPGDEQMTYEERQAFRKNLLRGYLHRHLHPQLAGELLQRDTEYRKNPFLLNTPPCAAEQRGESF